MAAWTYRCQSAGKAAQKIVPLRPRTPCWKGLGADSEEKREPVSDINTAVVDSLKVLDPEWPIREENQNSTRRWDDVPRGTMDEVRSYVRLDLPVSVCWQGRRKDCSTSSSNPMLEGP